MLAALRRLLALSPLRRAGLQWRIVFFFTVLLAVVQGIAFGLVDAANLRRAREMIIEELLVGERIFRRQLEQNARQLAQGAEVLSLDFAFRGAVATRDLETIRSALMNHGSRIQAELAALVSLQRAYIADARSPENAGRPFPLERLLAAAESSGSASGMAFLDGRVYQLVIVPVLAPEPVAWAVFGSRVDDRLARDLRGLTALHVSFLARSREDDWALAGSTLAAGLQPALRETAAQAHRAGMRAGSYELLGEAHEILIAPVEAAAGATIVTVLQRSLEEAMAPFRELGTLLLLLAVGSLAVSIGGSILIARGITRPLHALSDMTRRIEEGDYSRAVEIADKDEIGDLARRFNVMREGIAAREEYILRLAYRDVLTDLPNRALLNDRLNVAIEYARRASGPLTVLLLDLDRFKVINDTLGHHMGDQVLQQVARILASTVRKSDTTARLGGDEFAVLLAGSGAEQGRAIAEKITRLLEEPIRIGEHVFDVRASIGMASFPDHGEDADTLLRHADAAMYAAKRDNAGYAVYDPARHALKQEELSLLSELRFALEQSQFRLAYQPKVELATGRVAGVEGLLRWTHPARGPIPPARFIPFAEQTGYIRTMTRWVIETAVRQCAAWKAAGRTLKVSVNISVQDLLTPDLVEFLAGVLDRHGLAHGLLCLEITESSVMQDAARAMEIMRRIEALGVSRSIDDFGTGYSSLAYIKQLHVDEIKIDRAFVRNIVNDQRDVAIVLSTVELCHNLGLTVVAEGVEDEPSRDLLLRLGCDQAQGYLYTPALEAAQLVEWMAAHDARLQRAAA